MKAQKYLKKKQSAVDTSRRDSTLPKQLPAPIISKSESQQTQQTIPTPSFRTLINGPTNNKSQLSLSAIKHKEDTTDAGYLARHRPLENAERRDRKREEELLKYYLYISKLRKEYPELWDGRKVNFEL